MSCRRLHPEWAEQSAILYIWPHPAGDFGQNLAKLEKTFIKLTHAILSNTTARILCYDARHKTHIQQTLALNTPNLIYHVIPFNDIWIRDYGPLSLYDPSIQSTQYINFQFNGWGQKYPFERDNAITQHLYQQGALKSTPPIEVPLVLEGGSIETDGQGTLMTTEHCLLNPNRNPTYSKSALEQIFLTELGIENTLWLKTKPLLGDDTDAHIDTFARFCSNTQICYVGCDKKTDPQWNNLQHLENGILQSSNAQGNTYDCIRLPMPAMKYNKQGQPLPASYANFLILNDAVLWPTYEDNADDKAYDALSSIFKHKKLIDIDCLPLIEQYGSLHCATLNL